jgi:hypothetical protein
MEAGHYAISKKRRLEVAAAKEKEREIDKKNNSDKLKTALKIKKLEIEPSEIKFGFEAEQLKGMVETLKGIELNGQKSIETISNTLVSNNISSTNNSKEMVETINEVVLVNTEQLKQDSKQFKADNRISAAEEAAGAGSKTGIGGVLTTGGSSDKNKSVVEDGVGGIMSTISDVLSEGAGGVLAYKAINAGMGDSMSMKKLPQPPKTKSSGLKGVLKNIMAKFGKAGKFLMSFGARFLLPLISNPAGWIVLAGLAVGGFVFSYWDEIVSFVGKMFDGVKSMFSKVVSKISGMFSAVGDAIKEIVSFFSPANLAKTIAKALFPADMYGAISSFFGGDNAEEIESKEKKSTLKKEQAVGDKMESELSSAKSEQLDLGKSITSKNVIAAEKDGEVITIKVGQKFEGSTLRSASHANWKLKQSGYKVLSPEETNVIMDKNEKDIKLKEFDLSVQVKREEKLIDDISSLDSTVPTKPYKVGSNDVVWDTRVPTIKPNENSIIRKDEMVSGALQQGMDNKISQGSGNGGKKSSDTNIVSAPTVNNNTTIKKEGTHDTDMTSMSLNKSAFPQQGY